MVMKSQYIDSRLECRSVIQTLKLLFAVPTYVPPPPPRFSDNYQGYYVHQLMCTYTFDAVILWFFSSPALRQPLLHCFGVLVSSFNYTRLFERNPLTPISHSVPNVLLNTTSDLYSPIAVQWLKECIISCLNTKVQLEGNTLLSHDDYYNAQGHR